MLHGARGPRGTASLLGRRPSCLLCCPVASPCCSYGLRIVWTRDLHLLSARTKTAPLGCPLSPCLVVASLARPDPSPSSSEGFTAFPISARKQSCTVWMPLVALACFRVGSTLGTVASVIVLLPIWTWKKDCTLEMCPVVPSCRPIARVAGYAVIVVRSIPLFSIWVWTKLHMRGIPHRRIRSPYRSRHWNLRRRRPKHRCFSYLGHGTQAAPFR
ncbi:hypothetical protein DFH06DRAFT_648605 [Mycena polygramma]|nr:hypothetical protein DFH06DRAFT_648605 [Mycena polygramma]